MDWVAILGLIGGWVAAIAATLGLIYQRRAIKRIKADNVEDITNEIMYFTLYYGRNEIEHTYFILDEMYRLSNQSKPNIPAMHQRVKRRLMRET